MGFMKVKGATERTKQLRRGSTQIVGGGGVGLVNGLV